MSEKALPEPYYERDGITIYVGDNRDVLPHIGQVSAVVTDPPSGISFMGKEWDSNKGGRDQWIAWLAETLRGVSDAMLPGAHALIWALPRTSGWTSMAIEDAGLDVRDCITHLFGSGFPKSHDVSKAIDRMAGAEREVVGPNKFAAINGKANVNTYGVASRPDETAPATPEAEKWQGWGTSLKPAAEFWYLARKPFKGNVAANVLAHGTGALNIDASRIGHNEPERTTIRTAPKYSGRVLRSSSESDKSTINTPSQLGRWPANVILDEESARLLDEQSGERGKSSGGNSRFMNKPTDVYGLKGDTSSNGINPGYGDTGGASRYFKVIAQDCLSTYNVEEQECASCGDESTRDVSTSAGKRTVSNGDNSHTDGCGSRQTGLFQTGTKSTTSTTINSITSCPTCNVSPQSGTTTTTNDCGKITETSTALNIDAASDVANTSNSPSSSDARQEHIRVTASHASANTCESGEPQTANTTTPTCVNTESAITGSRFFYVAKASRRERNAGLEGMPERNASKMSGGHFSNQDNTSTSNQSRQYSNHHPTVKPLALMKYLIQMVTPPGGIVLDPFAGSGSTLVAAAELGFDAIGIELDPEYAEIAARRVDHALNERAKRLPGLEALS